MRTLGKAAVRIEEFYVLNDVCLDEERRIVVIIAFRLSTSQEHSYTSLANEAIKMDNLTTRLVCLWTAPIIFWCVIG